MKTCHDPKGKKTSLLKLFFLQSRKKNRMIFSIIPHTSTTAAASGNQEMLIQILLTCLKQAQASECLQMVTAHQRNVILRNVWTELFVLKISHWPIDINASIESCGDRHLLDIIGDTKSLSADLMELSLLEILILSRPEYAVNCKERLTLQFNFEQAISNLEFYISQQNAIHFFNETSRAQSALRFGKLLLGLRQLSVQLNQSSLHNFFRECSDRYFKKEK